MKCHCTVNMTANIYNPQRIVRTPLTVIDLLSRQTTDQSHLMQQKREILIQIKIPEIRCLDDTLHGCLRLHAIDTTGEQGVHSNREEDPYDPLQGTCLEHIIYSTF